MKRSVEDAQQTRREILEAALLEFTEAGYERATLQRIAEKASLTRGAVYHHFTNKAELLAELMTEAAAEMGMLVRQIQQDSLGLSTRQQLRNIMVGTLRHLGENARYESILRLVVAETEGHPELDKVRAVVSHMNQQNYQQLVMIFQGCLIRGELHLGVEAEMAAEALLCYQRGMHVRWLGLHSFSLDQDLEKLVDIFLKGLFLP